jgi:hypothetical protein
MARTNRAHSSGYWETLINNGEAVIMRETGNKSTIGSGLAQRGGGGGGDLNERLDWRLELHNFLLVICGIRLLSFMEKNLTFIICVSAITLYH